MTTPHRITPEWTGETVAVLASGPSLDAATVAALKKHKTIAVNRAHELAPNADILVALDGNWPAEYRAFKGRKITGVADETLDALYIGPQWEAVELEPQNTIFIVNSGFTAIRMAANMGAARIILAGFDYPHQTGHFYDDEVDEYAGLAEAVAAVVKELEAKGIAVERYEARQ